MLKPWVRWGSALIPTLVSGSVTSYLLSTSNWRQWGVEEMPTTTASPTSFADLANITYTADCITQGLPIEPCDPYGRRFQPYVVLPARVLAALGMGSDSTGAIGAVLGFVTVALVAGLAFLVASQRQRGAPSLLGTQIALALGAISPGIFLGIERGQIESLTAVLVVLSLIAFTSRTNIRWLGVPLSLLSTAMKYLTVGMFLAFANWETIAKRKWSVITGVAISGAFLLVSIPQLRQAAQTSDSGVPQTTMSAFGLTNTIASPLSGPTLTYLAPADVAEAWPTLRIIGFILFATAVAGIYLLIRRLELPAANSLAWVLTIGSGGVLLLPYLIGSSHDYRLIFLIPFIAGLGLWWGGTDDARATRLPPALITLATLALVTSASMLPTPQGWRWPTWLVIVGDVGLFAILAVTAALALSMALRTIRRDTLQ